MRVNAIERIKRCRGQASDAERIEDMDCAELAALARGDAGVLAFGVDADDRERIFEQIGDDRADTLAGAGGCDRQQMGGTSIAHRLTGFHVAADQQAVIVIERLGFPGCGKAGRTMCVGAITIVEPAKQGQDEHPDHDQHYGTADPEHAKLSDSAVLIEAEVPDRQHQQEEQRHEQHHREQLKQMDFPLYALH